MEHLPLPLCLSFICINALRYVCINTCVCLYICIYVRVYKSICMYTCPCTHTKSGQISISFSSLQQSWISPHIFICLVHICCPLASWFSLSSFSTLPLTLSFQKKNKFSLPLLKILFILQTVFFSLVVLVYKQVLKKLFNIFLLGKKKKEKKVHVVLDRREELYVHHGCVHINCEYMCCSLASSALWGRILVLTVHIRAITSHSLNPVIGLCYFQAALLPIQPFIRPSFKSWSPSLQRQAKLT